MIQTVADFLVIDSLASRFLQMAVLGPIVETFGGAVFDAQRKLAFGHAVGSQFVGDETLRRAAVLSH